MFRVSIKDDSPLATLKVEGKVVGDWAAELGNTWDGLWKSANRQPLRLDLRDVSFVDSKGIRILREIVRATGAEVFADSPLTQYFAELARSERAQDPPEET